MYKALILPLLLTIFLHLLVVVPFIFDAPSAEPVVRRAATQYIKAELVTLEKPVQKKQIDKSVQRKKAADSARAQAREKAAEQAKQQALALRKKAQQDRLAEEKNQQRKLAEAERSKKALDAKRRSQRERDRQRQSERELNDAVARENAQQGGDKQVVTAEEMANSYIALITDAIQNNWNRPPSARNGMEAELALQLMPTGEVLNVTVIKSSGNSAFDRSAENAVRRAGQFPELKNLPNKLFEQYFRKLRLKFRPEDLRL
jgi:colicin import membrane protein